VLIPPGQRKALRLAMAAEPADTAIKLHVQLVFQAGSWTAQDTHQLGLSFNGSWTRFHLQRHDQLLLPAGIHTHHLPEHLALQTILPVADIEQGWNELVIFNAHKAHTAELLSVELAVLPGAG
jgi:hypothetical protein